MGRPLKEGQRDEVWAIITNAIFGLGALGEHGEDVLFRHCAWSRTSAGWLAGQCNTSGSLGTHAAPRRPLNNLFGDPLSSP